MQKLMTLYGRTLSLIAVVFLMSFGVVALAFLSVRAMDERDQIRELQHNIMQANTSVRDFALKRDPTYAKQTEQWLKAADDILESGVKVDNYDRLHSELHLYLHSITQLIDAYKTRGFYEKDGLEGELTLLADSLLATIRSHGLGQAERDLLILRKAEKNYLLRGGDVYVDEVHETVDLLIEELRVGLDEPETTLQSARQLAAYQHDFDQMVMVIEKGAYIQSNLEYLANAIGSALDQIVISESLRAQRILWVSLVLVLVAFVLGVLYAVYISRSIVKPLSMLETAAHRLISGDGVFELHKDDQGDLQELTRAMQSLAAHIRDQEKIKDELEESAGHLALINDDLAVKKQELEHRAEKLDELVERLKRVKTEAEGSVQIKADFLARMSHEIRTPLSGIIGMTSLLAGEDLRNDLTEVVEVIRTSGETLLSLVNDILDFSKIEAGAVVLEEEPLDVVLCVEHALSLVSRQAARKGLELSSDIELSVGSSVIGDAGRLRQILVNLVGNAVKFTESGEVQVRAWRPDPSFHTVRFAVEDTGIGISPTALKHLFEPFQQAEASTSRRFGGTGLGLSISRQLSELMHGRMWVESQEETGSTFYFDIEAPLDPKASQESVELRARVLLVNNKPMFGRAMTRLLRSWGVMIDVAESEAEAADRVAATDYHVILLNDGPIGIDGVATLAVAHTLQAEAPDAQIHMMCHLGERMGRHEIPTLVKPVKRTALRDVLSSIAMRQGKGYGRARGNGRGPARPARPARSVPDPAGGARVLLVEDNVVNQKVGTHMLTRLGFDVDIACNGQEALAMISEYGYPLVFMDVQMPVMDGIEATRRIRRGEAGDHTPYIIALTANASTDDRSRCLDAGMDEYIPKPVNPASLARIIAKTGIPGTGPAHGPIDPAPAVNSAPAVKPASTVGPGVKAGA